MCEDLFKYQILYFSGNELNQQLENWLNKADLSYGPARAIIAPHAGYTYSGETAAWAYRQISPATVKRIFILGPSHHVRLRKCALTICKKYQTPLYDLKIDSQIVAELDATKEFQWMDMKTDEDEHSIEMHLPYIAKVMEDFKDQFTIVPILIGSLSPEVEQMYGEILAKYLADPQNLFVISSDFCHWGSRFRYTYYDKSAGPIWKSIENLDKAGMDIIETLNAESFTSYLQKYQNTICGRHPIGVLLQTIAALSKQNYQMSFKFLRYAQSNKCNNHNDSSVSYASGSLILN
ncbi:hypothetical protein PVAND_001186 [Polypedilum vanderplanki]|uniref:Protein MEMO1 n=1 Tax=Polypedilum vanderplanki TaxID=319348 RepID=A0A9J6BMJ9_POLVA|nr:hypothetical protein PVAND_001186 [Polypedilum vanderplanki]